MNEEQKSGLRRRISRLFINLGRKTEILEALKGEELDNITGFINGNETPPETTLSVELSSRLNLLKNYTNKVDIWFDKISNSMLKVSTEEAHDFLVKTGSEIEDFNQDINNI